MVVFRSTLGLIGAALALSAGAAPLDALLSATPEQVAPNGFVEIGTDHMNQRLDFFNIRESDPLTAGTKAGDYLGRHVNGAVRLRDGLWLSGGLWQRAISNATDTFDYTSWQVAGLYRFIEADGKVPAVALRLSAWGTRSAATESTSPVTVPGAILNTVKITEPADRQLQADLIGTWKLTPATDVSAVLGAGRTKLSYGALSATTTRNLCNYQLTFTGNDIFGTLAQPCTATGGVIQQFYDRSGDYGVDVANEIAWHGWFMQAGMNAAWRSGPWTLQAGYLFYKVQRSAIDDILAARGKPVYTQNSTVLLQTDYRFSAHLSTFVRAQLNSNLFFSEIPVTYNSSTSDRFSSRYTLFTAGLRADF